MTNNFQINTVYSNLLSKVNLYFTKQKSKQHFVINSNIRLKSIITEAVFAAIGNPAFCLYLYLTGVHFRGDLQHVLTPVNKK